MTVSIGERVEAEPSKPTDVFYLPPPIELDPNLFDAWLIQRRLFMEAMGWHQGDDRDTYDDDPATMQLILLDNETNEISAGMRLTPRQSIRDTLSWDMIPDTSKITLFDESLHNGVWDLTRLVPAQHFKDPQLRMDAFSQLFGAGLRQCINADSGHEPKWVFATTRGFYNSFSRAGIKFDQLLVVPSGHGRQNDTLLCSADPVKCTYHLAGDVNNVRTYENVLIGLEGTLE